MEIVITIIPGQRYVVWGNSITYNSVAYNVGDEFVGITDVTTYSGAGNASEISNLIGASLETYVLDDTGLFYPERLEIKEAALEVVQPLNGTVFPERLEIKETALEIASYNEPDVQIIDCN